MCAAFSSSLSIAFPEVSLAGMCSGVYEGGGAKRRREGKVSSKNVAESQQPAFQFCLRKKYS